MAASTSADGAIRSHTEHLLGGGVERLEGCAVRRGNQAAVDEVAVETVAQVAHDGISHRPTGVSASL
jgi:hypothetical protein